MSRIILAPYKMASSSARLLQTHLRRLYPGTVLRVGMGGNYRPRRNDLIINWGGTSPWHLGLPVTTVNLPHKVAVATNKLLTFEALHLHNIPIPAYTESPATAREWIQEGRKVIARTILNGHSGNGIIFLNPDEPIPSAPLYVEYISKIAEYRLHVLSGLVIDAQRKRKSTEAMASGTLDKRIRSHENGWVFTRENCYPDRSIYSMAAAAVSALGLDFGAVDIIVDRDNIPYVLEINTAPGLTDTTSSTYAEAILQNLRRY